GCGRIEQKADLQHDTKVGGEVLLQPGRHKALIEARHPYQEGQHLVAAMIMCWPSVAEEEVAQSVQRAVVHVEPVVMTSHTRLGMNRRRGHGSVKMTIGRSHVAQRPIFGGP